MSKLNESISNIVQFEQIPNGLFCNTINGIVEIISYNTNIARIRINKGTQFGRDFSYAVVQKPLGKFEIENGSNSISLFGEKFNISVAKDKLRLSFSNLDGTIINQDEDAFGVSWLGTTVTRYLKIQSGERFIGLGEKTGPLDRRGESYENWNTDKFAYPINQDPLYLSTPFYIGLHNGKCYGIFFDNTHKTTFNFGSSNNRFASYSAADGEMNYYFIFGENVTEILKEYSWLTGTMPLPPKWALGLQQCRYSYYPDKEVMNIARQYRDRKIPLDVIYLDIHYMDEYKVFTFHPTHFPEPKTLNKTLGDMGVKTVTIIDPGVKVELGYETYESGLKEDVFVKYPDGEYYQAEVWPGWCHFPDFTAEKTRNWWADKFNFLLKEGVSGFWNDMNEPACWGQRPPDLIEFDFDGETTTHREARNVYGMLMARANREGLLKFKPNERPFILNRAGFSGVQRYAALWTGDNIASDEHMILGAKLLNSMGLAGMPFTGYDIGGFAGDASPALFCRWVQIGVFSPLFRLHSMVNSRDAEPWSFGEEAEEISRNFISLRYRLLPYIYSTFKLASSTGLPIVRTMAIEHSFDTKVFDSRYEAQYYFGDSLLVCPSDSRQQYAKVYLPQGKWYNLFSDEQIKGECEIICETPMHKLPVFVKAGSIIPLQKCIQHTGEDAGDTLEIHIYTGANATFNLYEDDGISHDFEKGIIFDATVSWDDKERKLEIKVNQNSYKPAYSKFNIVVHGSAINSIFVNEKILNLESTIYHFIIPLSHFDPWEHAEILDKDKCRVAEGVVNFYI